MDEPKREGYEATCYCVDSAGDPHQGCPQCGGEGVVGVKEQTPTIVQALAFRKWAYENNLVGPDGQPRKILGTLPVTADGVIVGDGCTIYWWNAWLKNVSENRVDSAITASRNYSTREAAERAAKERSDGQ